MVDIIPGLKGFGTDTRAAYGDSLDPEIFIVTDLTLGNGTPGDSSRNGTDVKTGSFLEAINYNPDTNRGKIILFEVSGIIGNTTQQTWNLSNRYTTIAGQTAPSPGILLKNVNLAVRARDAVIQHIRARGSHAAGSSCIGIGTSLGGGGYLTVDNIVIDHCSFSWAYSEYSNILVHQYVSGGTTENITVSNCIAAEGIYKPGTAGPKGMQTSQDTTKVCILKNLFTGNNTRNPYTRGTKICVVNNLMYNNGDVNTSLYGGDNPTGGTDVAYVSNVGKGGPWGPASTYPNKVICQLHTLGAGSEIYLLDNRCDITNGDTAYVQSSASDWTKVDDDRAYLNGPFDAYKVLSAPADTLPTGLTATASSGVEDMITNGAGCRPADRDSVDTRLMNEVANGTGISSQLTSTPSFPTIAEYNIELSIPSNPHVDSGDGYTNLEKWLHGLSADVEGTGTYYPYTRFRGTSRPKPHYNMIGRGF